MIFILLRKKSNGSRKKNRVDKKSNRAYLYLNDDMNKAYQIIGYVRERVGRRGADP